MNRGPLLTLGGLVALFVLMFAVNLANSQPKAPPYGAPAPTAAPSSAGPGPGPASPLPSAPPSASTSATPSAAPSAKTVYPHEVVYAGRTKDGSTAVAVAVLNGRAAAYICDGRRVESWLKGQVEGEDEVALAGRGSALTATLRTSGADRLVGQVKTKGRTYAFELRAAQKPAGLYRAKGKKATIGWIVLPDGSQVGLQTGESGTRPAPKLDPDRPEVTTDDEQLEAGPVTGDTDI